MKYDWIDYTSAYKKVVDSWVDENAKRFTGCDEGFDEYYQCMVNEPETKPGENFWAKIIIANTDPVGIIAFGLWDNILTISEFIIRLDRRGNGLGSSALVELLAQSNDIIGVRIVDANAVIFPNNIASQKAFEKAGFIFHSEHPDGDAWYYRYHNNTCYCGHDCSRCITYIATQKNDDNLRRQSQSFYKEKFSIDIPLEKFNCDGGRSENVFELCKDCPFIKCCNRHDVDSCSKCLEYPCKEILNYEAKYVNKCNQISTPKVFAETADKQFSLLPISHNIDFTTLTACGECCVGCKKKETGICRGCIESDGHCEEWAQSKGCPIYKCAKEHKVQFCGICDEFPCNDLKTKIHWRPNVIEELRELAEVYRESEGK